MRLALLHASLARAPRDDMTGTASAMTGMAAPSAQLHAIELRVEHIGALFDAFDPFPIPSRDLRWPLAQRWQLYRRLAAAPVLVEAAQT